MVITVLGGMIFMYYLINIKISVKNVVGGNISVIGSNKHL